MPAPCCWLCKKQDPEPIKTPLSKLFSEFRRTHKDSWEAQRLLFTEEELDALNSVQMAPTYFA